MLLGMSKKAKELNSPSSEIHSVAITSLKGDDQNAREHPERNLEAIETSLKKFGQQKPIIVLKNGTVICGNGVFETAKKLGWTHIDVIYSKLNATDAKAFALADNRSSELSMWNPEILDASLKELSQEGYDLTDIGFADGDIAEIVGKDTWEANEDDENAAEVEYIEKIVVSLTDMKLRSLLTNEIKAIVKKNKWQEYVTIT